MDSLHRKGLKIDIPSTSKQAPDQMENGMHNTQRPVGPPPGGPPGPPGGWLHTRMSRQQEIVFNVMIAFLQIIPQSTLTTVFPVSRHIAESFSIRNPSILPWLVAAYALSFGTFILVSGRLGDIFGHKSMVVIGYCFMSFWSVVAGVSHYAGFQLFFVARGFQGLGASLMVPNGLALLGRTYPPGSKQKIFSFTLFGLFAPVGAYLGMLFGALFTQYATWWWSFYTLALVTTLLAITGQVVLISPPPTPKQLRPTKDKLRDMDWLGAVTGVGGLICVQVALVSAPAAGWDTQYIYMLLIIGLLLISFFIIVELKVAEQPLVPFRMLKADVGFVLGAVACGWGTFGVWTWFLWKFLLNIRRDSPLEAALHVVPIVPVALIASVLTAWMMRKCRPSWTLFWALVAFTLGPLLLAVDSRIDKSTYWSWTFASLLVMPFGMDLSFPAATLILSNFFPPHMQGVAGSLISTTVNYSISLGLGLASTVEVHVNSNGKDPLQGIRGGWFMGFGLGGLGTLICIAFVLKSIFYPSLPLPTGPPVGAGGGPGMQHMIQPPAPQERDLELQSTRKHSTATVSSRATTMVPDGTFSPKQKQSDLDMFKKFQFDMSSPASTVVNTPTTPAFSSSNNDSPNLHSRPPHKSSDKGKRRSSKKTHHSRNESTQHIISHSRSDSDIHSPPSPDSPPALSSSADPAMRLPTEPPAAYHSRGRGSFDSIDSDIVDDRDRPRQRDPDGFTFDVAAVVPRGMLGEKF